MLSVDVYQLLYVSGKVDEILDKSSSFNLLYLLDCLDICALDAMHRSKQETLATSDFCLLGTQ